MTARRQQAGYAAPFSRLTIFLGSFLLFLVQPMAGRTLLPAFGGTATVWVVCLCAFQTLLLAGYMHAHRVALGPRRRRTIHLWLLLLAAVWAFVAHWAWVRLGVSAGGAAAWWTLLCVAGLCGFPYVMLSANSSLVQSLAATDEGHGAYRLYAVSNAGSLCGLLAYPLLMEPYVTVGAQWHLFGLGIALYASLLRLVIRHADSAPRLRAVDGSGLKTGCSGGERREDIVKDEAEGKAAPRSQTIFHLPSARSKAPLWIALPALSCFLLNALTTHVTIDVMPMPMMWCLLLGIFLASYIVGFTGWAERNARWMGLSTMLAFLVLRVVMARPLADSPPWSLIGSHILFLATGCAFIHAWLYSLRPDANELTRFYLCGAIGGAIGGMSASLVAPMVFDKIAEWPVALALTSFATLCWFAARMRGGRAVAFAAAAMLLCAVSFWMWWCVARLETRTSVYRARGFYGAINVVESEARNGRGAGVVREFSHGTTIHGVQALLPGSERMPTAYYGPNACGWAVSAHPKYRNGRPMRVNLVGMGIGVMFCYGRTNDYYRAYEISPEVIRLATDTNLFTFVANCPAKVEICMGDARKGLEEELVLGMEPYDVIVIDAFTGDNIPYHLSTREAFRLYFSMLKPDGILCVNFSNWHLELEPFMRAIGEEFDIPLLGLVSENDFARLTFSAKVAFFCRKPEGLAAPPLGPKCDFIDFNQFPAMPRLPTDDKGSFLGLFRMGWHTSSPRR